MLPKDWYKKIIDIITNQLMDDDILWADTIFINVLTIQIRTIW
jgi:hypothetical protein